MLSDKEREKIQKILKRREELLTQKLVPLQSEFTHMYGKDLAQVILDKMSPIAKELMGLADPLKPPTPDALIKMKYEMPDILQQYSTEHLKVLTHKGILAMGEETLKKVDEAHFQSISRAVKNVQDSERYEYDRRLQFVLNAKKVEHKAQMEELQVKYENQIASLKETLRNIYEFQCAQEIDKTVQKCEEHLCLEHLKAKYLSLLKTFQQFLQKLPKSPCCEKVNYKDLEMIDSCGFLSFPERSQKMCFVPCGSTSTDISLEDKQKIQDEFNPRYKNADLALQWEALSVRKTADKDQLEESKQAELLKGVPPNTDLMLARQILSMFDFDEIVKNALHKTNKQGIIEDDGSKFAEVIKEEFYRSYNEDTLMDAITCLTYKYGRKSSAMLATTDSVELLKTRRSCLRDQPEKISNLELTTSYSDISKVEVLHDEDDYDEQTTDTAPTLEGAKSSSLEEQENLPETSSHRTIADTLKLESNSKSYWSRLVKIPKYECDRRLQFVLNAKKVEHKAQMEELQVKYENQIASLKETLKETLRNIYEFQCAQEIDKTVQKCEEHLCLEHLKAKYLSLLKTFQQFLQKLPKSPCCEKVNYKDLEMIDSCGFLSFPERSQKMCFVPCGSTSTDISLEDKQKIQDEFNPRYKNADLMLARQILSMFDFDEIVKNALHKTNKQGIIEDDGSKFAEVIKEEFYRSYNEDTLMDAITCLTYKYGRKSSAMLATTDSVELLKTRRSCLRDQPEKISNLELTTSYSDISKVEVLHDDYDEQTTDTAPTLEGAKSSSLEEQENLPETSSHRTIADTLKLESNSKNYWSRLVKIPKYMISPFISDADKYYHETTDEEWKKLIQKIEKGAPLDEEETSSIEDLINRDNDKSSGDGESIIDMLEKNEEISKMLHPRK